MHTLPNPPSIILLSSENLFVAASIVPKSNCKDSTVVNSLAAKHPKNKRYYTRKSNVSLS